MNFTQNEKLNQVSADTLIVGVDIGSQMYFARAFDWRGVELGKRVFKFSNTGVGFLTFVRLIDEMLQRIGMKK